MCLIWSGNPRALTPYAPAKVPTSSKPCSRKGVPCAQPSEKSRSATASRQICRNGSAIGVTRSPIPPRRAYSPLNGAELRPLPLAGRPRTPRRTLPYRFRTVCELHSARSLNPRMETTTARVTYGTAGGPGVRHFRLVNGKARTQYLQSCFVGHCKRGPGAPHARVTRVHAPGTLPESPVTTAVACPTPTPEPRSRALRIGLYRRARSAGRAPGGQRRSRARGS